MVGGGGPRDPPWSESVFCREGLTPVLAHPAVPPPSAFLEVPCALAPCRERAFIYPLVLAG